MVGKLSKTNNKKHPSPRGLVIWGCKLLQYREADYKKRKHTAWDGLCSQHARCNKWVFRITLQGERNKAWHNGPTPPNSQHATPPHTESTGQSSLIGNLLQGRILKMNYAISLKEKHFMENQPSKSNLRLLNYFGLAIQEQFPVLTSPGSHVSEEETILDVTCCVTSCSNINQSALHANIS